MTDPDVALLLRATTHAFESALHAVLAGDKHAARQVLRGSTARRAALQAAQDTVRARAWVPLPTKVEHLQFVADLGRVGDLVDHLARNVVAGGDPHPLSPSLRMMLAVLLDAGGRRLRALADGPVGPGLDPAHRGCGRTLFEVADRGTHDSSRTAALCSATAVVLLQASRHAARAA